MRTRYLLVFFLLGCGVFWITEAIAEDPYFKLKQIPLKSNFQESQIGPVQQPTDETDSCRPKDYYGYGQYFPEAKIIRVHTGVDSEYNCRVVFDPWPGRGCATLDFSVEVDEPARGAFICNQFITSRLEDTPIDFILFRKDIPEKPDLVVYKLDAVIFPGKRAD